MEVGCLIIAGQDPIWHLPPGRTAGSIPDSRDLWIVMWENREHLEGFAHSHPGTGTPTPSWEDLTTFSAVEAALGRRLTWWITSEDVVVEVIWVGPGKYDYHQYGNPRSEPPCGWIQQLRELSKSQQQRRT